MTIQDNGPYDSDPAVGTIQDPYSGPSGSGGGNHACSGDCYAPHLGVDEFGTVFYNDGLTINGRTYKVDNVLHNSPDTVLNLPVGEPVNVKLKAEDTYASQIQHCELGVAIPHGVFDKSLAAFIVEVDRDFDGSNVRSSVIGDATALKDLSVSFVDTGDRTAECTISFVPTKHLSNDMFSIEVWDSFKYTGTYYFNHGIVFERVSLVGTPVYQVMDSRGKISTISIIDQTLHDMTKAIDTDGNTWTLVDGFWQKDYIPNDLTCSLHDGRACIAFKDVATKQTELAKKYFDSSKLQKTVKNSYAIQYKDRLPRGPHELSPDMQKATETVKSSFLH